MILSSNLLRLSKSVFVGVVVTYKPVSFFLTADFFLSGFSIFSAVSILSSFFE